MAALRSSLLLVAVCTAPGAAFYYGFPSGKGSGPGPLARRVSTLDALSTGPAGIADPPGAVRFGIEWALVTPRNRAPLFVRSMRLALRTSHPPAAVCVQ